MAQIQNPKSKIENPLFHLTTRKLFVAILFLALFVMATRNVTDPDFGWHLRTGEYITTTFSIPHADFFSLTAAGEPWVTHEWLAQVFMFLLYQAGGFGALTLAFALIATLTFGLVYRRCEGQPFLAVFVALFAAITAAPFWGARPHTLSLLFTSVFLFILDRHRRVGNGRALLWLVPTMLLWANAHGSFALGPALIAVYLGASILEKYLRWSDPAPTWKPIAHLGGILIICIALIVVNPNGIRLYTYPFETLTSHSIQTFIQEWQPPDFTSIATQPFLIFLIVTGVGIVIARQRLRIADALLILIFTFFSLRASRQISIWVLIAAPLLAASATQVLKSVLARNDGFTTRPMTKGMTRLNWGLLSIFALVGLVRVASVVSNQSMVEREYFPVDAVNYIEQEKLYAPMLNQYNWGGYLIWRLYPRARVFIDGRSDLYGLTNDFIVNEYLKAYLGTADWREPLERYHIQMVLVEPEAPLAAQLIREAAWHPVYQDKQAIIFVVNSQ